MFLLIPYRTSVFLPFKNDLSLYFNCITNTVWYSNIFDWWMASSLESLKLTMWKQPKQLAHLMPIVPISSYYDQINPHCPYIYPCPTRLGPLECFLLLASRPQITRGYNNTGIWDNWKNVQGHCAFCNLLEIHSKLHWVYDRPLVILLED